MQLKVVKFAIKQLLVLALHKWIATLDTIDPLRSI